MRVKQEVNQQTRTYSVAEVAKILGISKNHVYRLLDKNQFKVMRFGSLYRIQKESFDNWFENYDEPLALSE